MIAAAMRSTSPDVRDALQQDRKLVAAEARDGIGRPGRLDQALRRRLQQAVAGGVTERIVDVLEVVEVQEHHGDELLASDAPAPARARRDCGTGCGWRAASADRGTRAGAAAPRAPCAR